jgi:type I restriction enzyme, S subunit
MSSVYGDLISVLPSDWPVRQVSEVAERILSGGTPSRDVPAYWDGQIPWVTPGELTNLRSKYLSETRESISSRGLAASGATLLPRDSLMVTTRATLGSIALAIRPISTNQGFKSVVFGQSADPSFYFHFFRMLLPELTRRSSGTTFLEISAKQFGEISIPVPPLSEQRMIAEILDTADAAIRSVELLIVKQEALREQLAYDLFTGSRRFDHDIKSAPSQSVDSWLYGRLPSVDAIPHGWRLVRLVEYAKLESGHTPSRNISSYWNGSIPWLSLHDTSSLSQHIINTTRYSVTMEGINNSSARLLPPGTVAFSRTATVGKCVILGRVMATSQDFACYICGSHVVNRYLLHLFRYMQVVWRALASGSTHQTVYMPVFENLQILLPPVAEQVRIADTLDAVDLTLDSLMSLEVKWRALRQGLMDDLLTGRVRVGASG